MIRNAVDLRPGDRLSLTGAEVVGVARAARHVTAVLRDGTLRRFPIDRPVHLRAA